MTSWMTTIISNNIQNLKSSVQIVADIIATQKEYLW